METYLDNHHIIEKALPEAKSDNAKESVLKNR